MQSAAPSPPWIPASPAKGNLAIGNLRENLPGLLKTPQGVQVELLLASIGVVAGYSSQYALWMETGWNPDRLPQGLGADLVVATTGAGERLFFGDRLNAYLTGEGRMPLHLWGYVRGALQDLGVEAGRHEDIRRSMYSNVAKSAGSPGFGVPTVPAAHRPPIAAPRLIRALWPSVLEIFRLRPPQGYLFHDEPDLDARHWPFVAFIVAGQFMRQTRGRVPPAVAATLVMESAIAASKVDPATAPLEKPGIRAR